MSDQAQDPAVDPAPDAPHDAHGAVAYEPRDFAPAAVVRFGIGLAVATAITAGVVFGMMRLMRARELRTDPPTTPLAFTDGTRRPPAPRLQETPYGDLAALQAEDARVLQEYGWSDQPGGRTRIPVHEAMRLLAQRGLPVRVAPSPAAPVTAGRNASAPTGGAR